jgi:hypothetical protein
LIDSLSQKSNSINSHLDLLFSKDVLARSLLVLQDFSYLIKTVFKAEILRKTTPTNYHTNLTCLFLSYFQGMELNSKLQLLISYFNSLQIIVLLLIKLDLEYVSNRCFKLLFLTLRQHFLYYVLYLLLLILFTILSGICST